MAYNSNAIDLEGEIFAQVFYAFVSDNTESKRLYTLTQPNSIYFIAKEEKVVNIRFYAWALSLRS